MLLGLTACNKYKWEEVGPLTNGETQGNGTLAVAQDGYLYFVNNVADDSSLTKDQNEWGANGFNGAIMKSKINADGTGHKEQQVPKNTLRDAHVSESIDVLQQELCRYQCQSASHQPTGTAKDDVLHRTSGHL
jgi:hypothetical protein